VKTWLSGATGLTGAALLNQLLNEPKFDRVIAFVRKPLHVVHPKLVESPADFEHMNETSFVDTVFCCLGTTIKTAGSEAAFRKVDYAYILAYAQAAKARGATHFSVISSIGADPNSRVLYSKVKGETERDLQRIGFQSLAIYRPSLLLGDRKEERSGEQYATIAMRVFKPLMLGPLKKYRAIHVNTVARAMLREALSPRPGTNIYESDLIEVMGK
jgi:uncharacterized protein YbjT (DUF2867 family)